MIETKERKLTVKPSQGDIKPAAKLEVITPELAGEYLLLNYEHNRKLQEARVIEIEDQIRRNQWVVNGATICFCVSGWLTDGQHRLAAILRGGKPVESMVCRNVPDKAFMTTDTGRSRTTADILHIAGEFSAVTLACAARYLQSWEKSKSFGYRERERLSGADAQAILRRHPGLRDAVREASHFNTAIRRIGPSFISAFFYLISTIDHSEACGFYDQLFLGSDLSKGHPIFSLRHTLLQAAQNPDKHRFDPFWTGRMFIKCWNMFAKGERIDTLFVKKNEELNELETPIGTYKARYQIMTTAA